MPDDGADRGATTVPKPAQLSFSVWRVNDYDLQIQHNEAVNLACEHIGVERTRTDAFFDGTLVEPVSLLRYSCWRGGAYPESNRGGRKCEARPDGRNGARGSASRAGLTEDMPRLASSRIEVRLKADTTPVLKPVLRSPLENGEMHPRHGVHVPARACVPIVRRSSHMIERPLTIPERLGVQTQVQLREELR